MRILIVEDDPEVAQLILDGFIKAGFSGQTIADGNEALDHALTENYDLLVVDVKLPGRDGLSLIEELRIRGRNMPVILLSAKKSVKARMEGFKAGADAYLVKPFSFSELLARAQTILRRTARLIESKKLKYMDLELDLLGRTIKRGNVIIELHPKEFALVEFLLRSQGKILTKSQILQHVWSYDFDPRTNVVDVLVCRVRNKIDRGFKIKLIKTFRGVGYSIRAD